MFCNFGEFREFLENPGISGKSGNFGKCRGNFSGFRGKLFFGISEIVKTSGTFLSNFVFFVKTALRSSVHSIKLYVNLVKIRVFSEKNPPKMSRDVSGKSPEIPRKKSAFFFRFFLYTMQRYSPFLQNFWEKISGKIVHFSGENFRENSRNSGKF